MEHLISDIERFCDARSMAPQNLLRSAINANWSQWGDWKSGKSSPTLATVDRIYAWMAANPATHRADDDATVTQ